MSSETDLARRSVEVIRSGQATTGAYLACPTFAPYRFSWLRDGAFVAEAMSRAGEPESAEAFFAWCAHVVESRAGAIRRGERLNARYTVDGEEADVDEWQEFQLDGYGLWLWALRGHCDRHGRPADPFADAIELTCDYLVRHLGEPCSDWWEEREGVHPATLACVHGGLAAWGRPEAGRAAEAARAALPLAPPDASLLVLMSPFGVVEPGSETLDLVERKLVGPGGGVHRHLDDTYYGGGQWLLLTALLGWQYADLGRREEAERALGWVAARATPAGELPEQVQDHLLFPERYREWVERWGPPPCPLLWSHAMYLILRDMLRSGASAATKVDIESSTE